MGQFKIVPLITPEQKARGIIGITPLPNDTLWVFYGVRGGDVFVSGGVSEPFDIAFLDSDGDVLELYERVNPPVDEAEAPSHTAYAIEAKGGTLNNKGIYPGKSVSVDALIKTREVR